MGKLTETLVTLMSQVDPNKYEDFIGYKKGIPVIYLRLKRGIYDTLQDELLFWKYITGTLKYWGFELNPYDE